MSEIKKKIYNFINSEIFKYLVCGGLTTIFSLVIFFVSYNLFITISLIDFQINGKDANWVFANFLSFFLSTIFAYFINKIFVFNYTDYKVKTIIREIAKFFAGRIFGYIVFDLGLMALLIYMFDLNVTISKIISCVFIVVFNYVVSKMFVYIQKK